MFCTTHNSIITILVMKAMNTATNLKLCGSAGRIFTWALLWIRLRLVDFGKAAQGSSSGTCSVRTVSEISAADLKISLLAPSFSWIIHHLLNYLKTLYYTITVKHLVWSRHYPHRICRDHDMSWMNGSVNCWYHIINIFAILL